MNKFHKFIVNSVMFFYPCKVFGKENIPEGKSILVCNHLSALDPGYLAKIYSKDAYFLAKKELFNKKILAGPLKRFGGIPIDRDKPELKTVMQVIKILKEEHKLIIFPEGTRNKKQNVELLELKKGSAFFSVKTQTPIVPVFMYRKAKFLRKNYLIIGKPFEFADYYGKKITEEDEKNMNDILRNEMLNQRKILFDIVKKIKK